MNLYGLVDTGAGMATDLSARLRAWHDAMVAHERRRRTRPTDEVCDDECPHAEARDLWVAAREVLGDRARDLTFLRTKAEGGRASR